MQTQSALIYLPVPVPLALENAVGYTGDGSWFGMYWTPAGDEVMLVDRWSEYTGEWAGYLAYVRHHRVARHLVGYNFGGSDVEPDHWLLINRETRQAFTASEETARAFLAGLDDPMPELNQRLEKAVDSGINAVLAVFQSRAVSEMSMGDYLRQRQESLVKLKNALDGVVSEATEDAIV